MTSGNPERQDLVKTEADLSQISRQPRPVFFILKCLTLGKSRYPNQSSPSHYASRSQSNSSRQVAKQIMQTAFNAYHCTLIRCKLFVLPVCVETVIAR